MSFPDFAFNTNNIIRFNSMESLIEYAEAMLDKPMYGSTETFNSWSAAFEKYFVEQNNNVKIVNVHGQEYYEMPEIVRTDAHWTASGDPISVSSGSQATQSSAASAVGGGGVKSPPKVQTIVTDESTGGAVPGDQAKGLKNFGLPTKNELANLVDGLCKAFGIANLAINAQNLGLWRAFCNYVFDADMPADVSLSDVINFLFSTTETIVARDSNNKIVTMVPESIARKMYNFFADHITQTGGHGEINLYLTDLMFSLVVWGNASSSYGDRYLQCITNVAPNTGAFYIPYTKPSDIVLQHNVNDFCNCLTGAGFTMPSNVTEALVASMEGVFDRIFSQTSVIDVFGNIDNVVFYNLQCIMDRGSNPPPKSTPISASEIRFVLTIYDFDLHIDTSLGEDDPRIPSHFLVDSIPSKYVKRGHTGEYADDYAYTPMVDYRDLPQDGFYKRQITTITYPSNVQSFSFTAAQETEYPAVANSWFPGKVSINGWSSGDISESVPDSGYDGSVVYSNFGYRGVSTSYDFDDTISAGFIKRTWDVPESPDILPHENSTIDGVFPTWVAEVKTLSQSDADGNEKQTKYLPVTLPHGEDNARTVVEEGGNSTTTPKRTQSRNQSGELDPNEDVEPINKEIERTVRDYNDSRITPESAPNQIPETYPNPQYPTNPPAETDGDSGDPTPPATLPGVEASGMVSVYNPTKAQIISFSSWLWTTNIIENIKKLLQDPMDAIIGLHIMYATPHTTSPSNIIVGWLDSEVQAKVVDQQYTQLDCGDVFVPEYYGDVLDYEPYVHIHLYLPFVGIVSLKPNDVIGKTVNVTYGIDALTGTCLAMVTTTKGTSKIQCYTFPGNCAVQIPLTGGSYASVIRGISSMAVGVAGSVATGNALGAVGGVIGGVMSSHLDVSHSGTLGANAGAMGVKKPYLIITRKVAYDAAGYNQFYGYPANKTVTLGSCKGYTRVKSVHIESIPIATSDEKQMIETLLKQGVIIR